MSGKASYGPFDSTQGGVGGVVPDPTIPFIQGRSGSSHPIWPTDLYDTVVDGDITWTAIYSRVITGTVTDRINRAIFQNDLAIYPDHYFQYGRVQWITGNNTGKFSEVRDSLGGSAGIPYIYLLEAMPNRMEVGDTFLATVGCAKIRLTCQQFNNLDNHRAFPDMPTEDKALSTPNISAQGYAPKTTK